MCIRDRTRPGQTVIEAERKDAPGATKSPTSMIVPIAQLLTEVVEKGEAETIATMGEAETIVTRDETLETIVTMDETLETTETTTEERILVIENLEVAAAEIVMIEAIENRMTATNPVAVGSGRTETTETHAIAKRFKTIAAFPIEETIETRKATIATRKNHVTREAGVANGLIRTTMTEPIKTNADVFPLGMRRSIS